MKKSIEPDAFMYDAWKAFDLSDTDEKTLREKFMKDYEWQIQRLYEEFLKKEFRDRITAEYPALAVRLCKTGLSARAVHMLRAYDIDTVFDLAQYSLKEISSFSNIGKKTLAEIDGFMKGLGITGSRI